MPAHAPVPTFLIAVVVVRSQDRFLLVQERKQGRPWYLPAGRAWPGESVMEAALRETQEESGLAVELDGVLRVEHTPSPYGVACLRYFFHATPIDSEPPRTYENEHTLGAAWVKLAELDRYPLRDDEVREILGYVAAGGAVHPLSLLTVQRAPWNAPLSSA